MDREAAVRVVRTARASVARRARTRVRRLVIVLPTVIVSVGFLAWSNEVGGGFNSFDSIVALTAMYLLVPLTVTWLIGRFEAADVYREVRRRLPNACPACGYDLTGNRSGVCPECGRAVEAVDKPVQSPP